MAPGRKQGGSCWTCRLRRKRCNLARPVCEGCEILGITCHIGQAKPSWMDGAERQKQMSETIKRRIKQNAALARERRTLTHEDQNMVFTAEMDHPLETDTRSTLASSASPTSSNASTPLTDSIAPTYLDTSTGWSNGSPATFTTPSSTSDLFTPSIPLASGSSWPAGPAAPIQMHFGAVMMYLDYVFPFLFPFYQPPLVETGRQWLLGLLCQNEVSFHIAASLSAYFFALIPQKDGRPMNEGCTVLVRDRLFRQMEMAVKSIQNTVSIISEDGAQRPLLDKVRVMEEITQLLIVEVTIQRNVNWTIHLTPALVLLYEILNANGIDRSGSVLSPLLSALPSSIPPDTPHNKPLPNTADQSALVFFVSLLVFVDVVASTSLRLSPTVKGWHSNLLSIAGEDTSRIRMETVVGCQNWAFVAIGNISSLCAWKREAKIRGDFSAVHIVDFARPISEALVEGLLNLRTEMTDPEPPKSGTSRLESYYSRHDGAIGKKFIACITRIWANAAMIYLETTLSGWQAHSEHIQRSINEILRDLRIVDSPAQLRSLSWPICVAACLALPDQQHEFRRIIGVMGRLSEFGTIRDVLDITEAVWRLEGTIDRDNWDIASCLNILGSPALLV